MSSCSRGVQPDCAAEARGAPTIPRAPHESARSQRKCGNDRELIISRRLSRESGEARPDDSHRNSKSELPEFIGLRPPVWCSVRSTAGERISTGAVGASDPSHAPQPIDDLQASRAPSPRPRTPTPSRVGFQSELRRHAPTRIASPTFLACLPHYRHFGWFGVVAAAAREKQPEGSANDSEAPRGRLTIPQALGRITVGTPVVGWPNTGTLCQSVIH